MKVLIISRSTLKSSPGGDTVQIIETAKALRKIGCIIDVKLSNEVINYQPYNLIHFFNIIRPNDIIDHVERTSIPFVISTIFVDYSEYEKRNRKGILGLVMNLFSPNQIEFLKSIARHIVNGEKINGISYFLKGHKGSIEFLLNKASMLLPNSDNEYSRLKKSYKFENRYIKVPNAVSSDFFWNSNDRSSRDGVICVGRIEGRKNQLNLIRALKDSGIRLTIIGNYSPNHKQYYEQCVAEAGSNVDFISHIDKGEIIKHYLTHKVHVLASWFETTGLSTLESAAMGCNIVITDKGDTKEYFGDYAHYCFPEDVKSIREAIDDALESDYNNEFKEIIRSDYNWGKAAQKTKEAYEQVLGLAN